MKKVEAIIRSTKLRDVVEALERNGFDSMTITEVHGLGREKAAEGMYRGGVLTHGLVPRHKVEVLVADDAEDAVVDAIYRSAHTGEVGDGRVVVTNLEATVHIRTGAIDESLHPVGI